MSASDRWLVRNQNIVISRSCSIPVFLLLNQFTRIARIGQLMSCISMQTQVESIFCSSILLLLWFVAFDRFHFCWLCKGEPACLCFRVPSEGRLIFVFWTRHPRVSAVGTVSAVVVSAIVSVVSASPTRVSPASAAVSVVVSVISPVRRPLIIHLNVYL